MFAPHKPTALRFDIVLVGGGLANGLIAMALLERRPELRVALVEAGEHLGGNHTWCFHPDDVSESARSFVDPLVERRWPAYTVHFPGLERRVEHEYATFTGQRLDTTLSAAFEASEGSALFLRSRAHGIAEQLVTLDNGTVLRGDLVIDGRGPQHLGRTKNCRYQKFLGLELCLKAPSPVREPILMDARVSQSDGFRFVYALPFDERRILLEDTYFSDDPVLDETALERRIFAYAHQHGFSIDSIVRRERGILPLPLETPQPGVRRRPLVAGYQGGWFHPTTGYSFPAAVRLAEFVSTHEPTDRLAESFDELAGEVRRQQRYFTLLNRLLYGAFAPEQRFNVLQRFYELPSPTIRRFYAMQTTTSDRARILCGRPPRGLSLKRALFQASTT